MSTVHSELRSDNPAFDAEMDAIRAELRAETEAEENDAAYREDMRRAEAGWWHALGEGMPDVDGVVLTMADWLGQQASYYTSLGTKAGDFAAATFAGLAEQARALWATTPEALAHRMSVADATRAEDLVQAGYVRGVEDGRNEWAPGGRD